MLRINRWLFLGVISCGLWLFSKVNAMDKVQKSLPSRRWDINDPELVIAASLGYYYEILKERELRLKGKWLAQQEKLKTKGGGDQSK